jgi:hypothetical protein
MDRSLLKAANRELLRAIETPPDTGRERRLDELARHLWLLATDRTRSVDSGRLSRLQYALTDLCSEVHPGRAYYLSRARTYLVSYRETAAGEAGVHQSS